MDPVDVAKVVSMVVLSVVFFILGMIPVLINKKLKWRGDGKGMSRTANAWISGLLCYGGGILMATSLLHLFPEIREGFETLVSSGQLDTELPIAEIVLCSGFFMVYLIEEIVHFFADRHAHSKIDVSIHRSLALRECSVSRDGPTPPCGSGTDEVECTKESICKLDCQVREFCRDVEAADSAHNKISKVSDEFKAKKTEKIQIKSGSEKFDFYDGPHDKHHHHGLMAGDHESFLATLRGLLVVVGLSVHEIFEGLALGLESDEADAWQLMGAISAHKFVIAFCIGLDMAISGVRLCIHVTYILILSVITSIGIGIGMAVTHANQEVEETSLVSAVLRGLSAGTLLYVAFFEILERERSKGNNRLLQWVVILLGFLTILGLEAIVGHHHEHDHDHDHLCETTTSLITSTVASIP